MEGIRTKNVDQLRFKWFSVKVLYSIVVISGIALITALTLAWVILNDISVGKIGKRYLVASTCNIKSINIQ